MSDSFLKILVLGDSSLSSLGCCSQNAFDYFTKNTKYNKEINFVNASFVGMTSADIRSNLDDAFQKNKFDCVMIYTGNCDASAYGLLKPRVPIVSNPATAKIVDTFYKALNPVSRRYSPFQFISENNTRGKLRRCVLPADFENNLIAIIRKVLKNGCKLILINPVSKTVFPPSNNFPNAVFFKIFNVHNDIFLSPDGMSIQKKDLRDICKHLQVDDLKRMLEEVLELSIDNNLKKILINNLSYLYYLDKNEDDAERVLSTVKSDNDPYQHINLYNKALMHLFRGEEHQANILFNTIKEADCSTYRITGEYRDCIARVQKKFKDRIEYIDCADVLSENDFYDYCHPTETGHSKLFTVVQPVIEQLFGLQSGSSVPKVTYYSMNPDKYLGYTKHTFEHFNLVNQASDTFVDSIKELAQSVTYEEVLSISDSVERYSPEEKIKYRILKHPLFGTYAFLNNSPPKCGADQGRFAELYFLRHLINIGKNVATCERLRTLVKETEEISPDFKKLSVFIEDIKMWCSIPELTELKELFKFIDLDLVEKRLVLQLKYVLKKEPVVFNKYRSIPTWFFRESLLFGSASHYLMYCDRVTMFDLVTTLIFIFWHLKDVNTGIVQRYECILKNIIVLKNIHKQFLQPIAHNIPLLSNEKLTDYLEMLNKLYDEVSLMYNDAIKRGNECFLQE